MWNAPPRNGTDVAVQGWGKGRIHNGIHPAGAHPARHAMPLHVASNAKRPGFPTWSSPDTKGRMGCAHVRFFGCFQQPTSARCVSHFLWLFFFFVFVFVGLFFAHIEVACIYLLTRCSIVLIIWCGRYQIETDRLSWKESPSLPSADSAIPAKSSGEITPIIERVRDGTLCFAVGSHAREASIPYSQMLQVNCYNRTIEIETAPEGSLSQTQFQELLLRCFTTEDGAPPSAMIGTVAERATPTGPAGGTRNGACVFCFHLHQPDVGVYWLLLLLLLLCVCSTAIDVWKCLVCLCLCISVFCFCLFEN